MIQISIIIYYEIGELLMRLAEIHHFIIMSVLRWMMDNIYIKTDPAINIKADKAKSTEITVPRFMMTAAFYLYDFSINSIKYNILLREYPLNTLTFPLICAMI